MRDTGRIHSQADELDARAQRVTVGGVTAGGRFDATIGRAPFFARGLGPRLWDVDGREFLDFTASQGASILGHGDPGIEAAVLRGLELGTICTAETEHHVSLAERIATACHADRVRLTVTGTEATMAAIRVARAATGRSLVLKFDGHFHGMHDYVFFNSATPERPYELVVPSVADSAGIPAAVANLVVTVPFNDVAALRDALERFGDDIACVILEPVAFNMGCVPADRGWLLALREETRRRGIVLIFDEVLSGFRERFGGAGDYYGVQPDLSTWAKALGAGWPIAALTGRAEVMDQLNPVGGVIVSGTYTGHLCSVLASHAALEAMSAPGFFERLNARTKAFCDGIAGLADEVGIPLQVQRFGSVFGLYFGLGAPVRDYRGARTFDASLNARFCAASRDAGLYFHLFGHRVVPMHYRLTAAHTDADIAQALTQLRGVFRQLASGGS